jgi:mediator of replication checkpoint protein 1
MFVGLFSAAVLLTSILSHREQQELDDQKLQKLHEDATKGELRKKRRNNGVGFDGSDDDSDEDEKSRRIRQGMNKKRKVDRGDIKALGSWSILALI